MTASHITNYAAPVNPDLLQAIPTGRNADHIARRFARIKSIQATAADATVLGDVMEAAGEIVNVRAVIHGAMPAAGESITVDVQKNGVSVLTAVVTLNSSSTLDKAVDGVFAGGGKVRVAAGDIITVVRDYTAGGGPTPLTYSVVYVEVEYD